MSIVKMFRKTVVERRPLYLSYECWLESGEKLTDFSVTTTPYTADAPLTITSGYTDANNIKVAMFVGGGEANTNYVMHMVAKTNSGQVKRDDVGMRVLP